MPELWELTASEAAEGIRRGELTATRLTECLLKRIDSLDGRLRAWETVDAEAALQAARERDEEAAAGRWRGPLHGVPLGVKDVYYTAGLRTTAAFPPFQSFAPTEDATVVARLRAAGAFVLGKTVTTQFAYVDPPPTANAWNLERTPGGSSSGSGAAVGARMVPLALGTQTVGSVLRPAAYNGAVGFKPTFGRVSRYGIFPLAWSLDHPGWICRSVEDAALVLQVVEGHDERDRTTANRPPDPALERVDAPPRFLLLQDFLDRAAPRMKEHLANVCERLRAAGAEIEAIHLPDGLLDLALAVQHVIMIVEAASVHAGMLDREFEHYRPLFRADLQVGTVVPGSAYVHAQRLRRRLRRTVLDLLGDRDAFLTPTISDEAPDRSTTGDRVPQAPWSLFGLPAISLPSGLSENRLPLAIQLVGRPWADRRILAHASWCERTLGRLGGPALT